MNKINFIKRRQASGVLLFLCTIVATSVLIAGCGKEKPSAHLPSAEAPIDATACPLETTEETVAPTERIDYQADAPETIESTSAS